MADELLVKYIGNRPIKHDNVCGTGLVWEQGQVIAVPIKQAERFAKYLGVWKIVTEADMDDDEPIYEKEITDVGSVGDYTVEQIKGMVGKLDDQQLLDWLNEEQASSNPRKTVIAEIEDELDDRTNG